jgi:hypothetical protein
MRIHMPHVHMPHLEDRQVKSFGRSLAVLVIVGLMMAVFAAAFLYEAPIPQPDWLR